MFERGLARWPWALAALLALGVAGCRNRDASDGQADTGAAASGAADPDAEAEPFNPDPSPPAKDDRIADLSSAAVPLAPGYLDGAMLVLNWRAGVMQELLQSVPVSPRVAKDLAEVGAQVIGVRGERSETTGGERSSPSQSAEDKSGVDPRVDDVLGYLGVDANARISLSVRPLLDGAERVAAAVNAQQVDASLQRELVGLGLHLRVHLPIAGPGRIDEVLARLGAALTSERWATVCASLGPTRACGGDSSTAVVVRDVAGGLQLDAFMSFADVEAVADDPRGATLRAVIEAPAMREHAELAALRGDAILLADAPAFVAALETGSLVRQADLLARPELEPESDLDQGLIDDARERSAALHALHDTERVFDGLTIELELDRELDRAGALGRVRWRPSASGRARLPELFSLSQVDADVPSIAALCDGALLCGRSRGIPQRTRFAPLATGLYATPRELGRMVDRHEEEALVLLALETWPNALASLAMLPEPNADRAEAMIVRNLIDIATRVLGFGFSLRSLADTRPAPIGVRGERSETTGGERSSPSQSAQTALIGDWVVYARSNAGDLSALRGYLRMAELEVSAITIPELPGRIELTRLPAPDVPGNYYAIYEPKAETGEWGWAVLADADDRVRWLASLPRDDGSVPLAYLEAGDLWRLIASFDEGRRELGYAQSWLSGRWIRSQLSLADDGAPELRVAMGKRE